MANYLPGRRSLFKTHKGQNMLMILIDAVVLMGLLIAFQEVERSMGALRH